MNKVGLLLAAPMLTAQVAPLGAPAQDAAQPAPAFILRADPSVAPQLNRVLRAVAEPIVVRLNEDVSAPDLLKSLCGEGAPSDFQEILEQVDGKEAPAVRFLPCLRQRANVQVTVRTGDSLEAIAVRLGLRQSSSSLLTVKRDSTALPAAAVLMPGDVATAKSVPGWTSFTGRPDLLKSRADLIAAIAKELGCPSADEETCLHSRGILVLSPKPQPPAPQAAVPVSDPVIPASATIPLQQFASGDSVSALKDFWTSAKAAKAFDKTLMSSSGLQTLASVAEVEPSNDKQAGTPGTVDPAGSTLPGSSAPAVTYPASLSASDLASAQVAPSQWPEDQDLIARILLKSSQLSPMRDAVLTVADNGLAGASGDPFKREVFVTKLDDAGQDIPDAVIGAGIARTSDDDTLIGDVALCPAPMPDFASWEGKRLQKASHGTVVTSLASALSLRTRNPAVAGALPRIQFFRVAANACSDSTGEDERAAIDALEFAQNSSVRVLNLSALVDGAEGTSFADRFDHLALYPPVPLLVLPAGNSGENVDEASSCPLCLGSLSHGPVAKNVLVVGAAGRDLRVKSYSARGFGTVRVFAPDEPTGAVDLLGRSAASFDPSTSYAAPRAALGASMISMQGVDDIIRLRNRTLLSVWPLYDGSGSRVGRAGGPLDVGVIDLVKAAGVRFDIVEVIERAADNALYRRTYVGDLVGGLDGVCPGTLIAPNKLLAVQLSAAGRDGLRPTVLVSRELDKQKRDPISVPKTCAPVGALKLDAIRDGALELPLSAVTQILFRAK